MKGYYFTKFFNAYIGFLVPICMTMFVYKKFVNIKLLSRGIGSPHKIIMQLSLWLHQLLSLLGKDGVQRLAEFTCKLFLISLPQGAPLSIADFPAPLHPFLAPQGSTNDPTC